MTSLHLEPFPAAAPDQVPEPEPVPLDSLVKEYQRAAVVNISFFRRKRRRAAREQARIDAEQEVGRTNAKNAEIHRGLIQESAEAWQWLMDHDPESVITAIDSAFADNASESTCVDAGTDEDGARYATVVVVFGSVALVPEKVAALTPTGRQTVRKRTKTDRNSLYVQALGSTVLATVREALQTSPSTSRVQVVVLRRDPEETMTAHAAPIYTATFARHEVDPLDLERVDLVRFLAEQPGARLTRKGSTAEVVAVDIQDEADLQRLTAQFAGLLAAP